MLKEFALNGIMEPVEFIETMKVKLGVVCHVYKFKNRSDCDLGIIEISKGENTPKQKILKGEKTIEGYISGSGKFTIQNQDKISKIYEIKNGNQEFQIDLVVGDVMQWTANVNEELTCFEVCFPAYEEGRFLNLDTND